MNTAIAWQESAIRSERVRAAVERNTRAGKRTGGGSKPFGYKIIRHHQGEGARRRWRIVGEELEPAEAKLIKDAATRVLRGESLRSIAMDRNKRGIKTVGASSTKPKDERTDQDRRPCMARVDDQTRAGITKDCGTARAPRRSDHQGRGAGQGCVARNHQQRDASPAGRAAEGPEPPTREPREAARPPPSLACSTADHAMVGWSAISSRDSVDATDAGKTRTQTARPECESSPGLWRLTSRAT
jgi:hypothetical protein